MRDDILQPASAIWHEFGGVAASSLRIVGIVVAAWIAIGIANRSIRALRVRVATRFEDPEAVKRAETLGRVFRYLTSVIVSVIAVMLVHAEVGISVAPILGAAGVVGLAIGFGAQSLVKGLLHRLLPAAREPDPAGRCRQARRPFRAGRGGDAALRPAPRL